MSRQLREGNQWVLQISITKEDRENNGHVGKTFATPTRFTFNNLACLNTILKGADIFPLSQLPIAVMLSTNN